MVATAVKPPRVSVNPCTRATSRCSDARDYMVELAPCCRSHVVALMAATAEFLNSIRAVWWADYGTLLGAVRNPMTTWADYPWLRQEGRDTRGPAAGIVPHDKDGDLGVLIKSWPVALERFPAFLTARDFYLYKNTFRRSMKARLSFKNHTNVDVFFWKDRADALYRDRYAAVDKHKGKEFPTSLLFPLSTVEWEGLTLPAPRDPEAFLEMRYGRNWRHPVAENTEAAAIRAGRLPDNAWCRPA